MHLVNRTITRRKVLAGLGAGVALAALGRNAASTEASTRNENRQNHLSWVWQFGEDGTPEHIRRVLSTFGVGILLKTHDGPNWMTKWDDHNFAIGGPRDVQRVSEYFESAGVPFHAWAVIKGTDPIREAQMCAEVLSSGARSMTFDLEPPENGHYWQAGSNEAIEFGRELRKLQPNAWLSVAPDPRPWQVKVVPMQEFASFSNEIAPQTYWDTFNSSANYRLLRDWGFNVGSDGVTPELILDVTKSALGPMGRPIRPVGQGTAHTDAWRRFVSHGKSIGMDAVSVWRFGRTTPDVWPLLSDMRPNELTQPSIAPRRERDDDDDEGEKDNRESNRGASTPSSTQTSSPRTSSANDENDDNKKPKSSNSRNLFNSPVNSRERDWSKERSKR